MKDARLISLCALCEGDDIQVSNPKAIHFGRIGIVRKLIDKKMAVVTFDAIVDHIIPTEYLVKIFPYK